MRPADDTYPQIWVFNVARAAATTVTSDRVNSFDPVWSPDGKWMYLLSERHIESVVGSPWGLREPEPFFDQPVRIYALSLAAGQRSPFQPADELHPADKPKKKEAKDKAAESNAIPAVAIDLPGIQTRAEQVPVPPGNYRSLAMNAKRLFVIASGGGRASRTNATLKMLEITNEDAKLKTLAEAIESFELSADGKKLLHPQGR